WSCLENEAAPWFLWFGAMIVWSGVKLVAEFPAKLVLKGNLVLSADVFPRQGGFGGLSDRDLN
ncbi:MAG: hypothetical protein WAW47_01110, partial [Trichococcus flocculiformis]